MIVGIGHKVRRGKDTAADALVRELGFTKLGFSFKLKELAHAANPMVVAEQGYVNVQVGFNRLATLVDRYGWEYVKDHYPEARKFLQDLGQSARAAFGEDFWFNRWVEAIGLGDVVVPDLRFQNEARGLRERGAVLIRIDRVIPGAADNDISEHDLDGWDDWDLIVQNSGTIADLERQVIEFVKSKSQPSLFQEVSV